MAGTAGTRGPSDAWEASASYANITSSPETLSVTVPAGSYMINAQTQADNDSLTSTGLECWINAGSQQLTIGYFLVPPDFGPLAGGVASAALHATYKATASTTLTYECGQYHASETLYLDAPSLSAIQVGTLH